MLKKFAADALGISDIGQIISSDKYHLVDADDYIMHEDGEKIFFLIKSKTDEYCFTNLAFIHVDGTSAVSKKRTVRRYEYYCNHISRVEIETAGTVDLDCELKFILGDVMFSIDVDKKQLESLKDIYKALIQIGLLNSHNRDLLQRAEKSLDVTAMSLGRTTIDSQSYLELFTAVNEYSFDWLKQAKETYIQKDFSNVFKNYINN